MDPISPISNRSPLPPIQIEWATSSVSPEDTSPLTIRIIPNPLSVSQDREKVETAMQASGLRSSWQIPTHEIINLIWRISPAGELNYNDLKLFRPQSAREAEIQNFLLEQSLFFVLSQMDQGKQTLSPQDIRQAARLAGDPFSLETNDLKYIREPAPTTPEDSPTLTQPLGKEQSAASKPIDRENSFLQDERRRNLQPQSGTPAFNSIPPRTILPPTPETRQLAASVFQPVQTPAPNAENRRSQLVGKMDEQLQTLQSQLKRPIAMQSLKMQEWMVAAGYLKGVDNRSIKESKERLDGTDSLKQKTALEAIEPLQPLTTADSNIFRQATGPAIQEPVWSVKDLEAFIQAISPSGSISWQQLVAYQPQNHQERLFYELLKNPVLFYALAECDGDDKTLSFADIEKAAEYDHHPDILSGEDIAHLKKERQKHNPFK